jgi:hypothetical protein
MIKDFAKDARQHGRFGQYGTLAWTASWGWSCGVAADAAGTLSGKSRGTAARLAAMGLLEAKEWQHSNHVKIHYFVTKAGIAHALENQDFAREFAREHGYPFSPVPPKIPSFKAHSAVHDLFCQVICATALILDDRQCGRASTFYATPDLYGGYVRGQKIPDFLIVRENSEDTYEFEYSKKSKAEILNFIDHYYRQSQTGEGKKKRVFVRSISQGIQNQFLSVWKQGELVAPFGRDQVGRWVQSNIIGTRIEHQAEDCGVDFQVVVDGWTGLLRGLAGTGKLPPISSSPPPAQAQTGVVNGIDW